MSMIAKALKRGPLQLMAALAVIIMVGGFLGFIVINAAEGGRALLYSGLDLTESAEIAGKLDQANIPYRMQGNGSAIFVPRDRVLDARIMLSEMGLPTHGSVGYEIFDRSETLGVTSFIQNINRVRALEGELARTIASLEIVRSARVHLVMPERRLFERDQQSPSASVVLEIAGRDLGAARVRGIRNLVAGAVPGLEPDRISVLDDQGRLLAAGEERSENGMSTARAYERQIGIEERLRATVLELVEGVTGPGAARVHISADVDFNRITNNSERFDPDSRVVRSTQIIEERNDEEANEPLNATTATNNIPGDANAANDATSQLSSNRVEETVNYEISRYTSTEIIESGQIKRLSVAVAIDDIRVIAEDGSSEYTRRSPEEIERISTLVRSAIGFDESRGDVVEIVNISFVRPNISMEGAEAPGAFDFDKHDIMRVLEIISFLIVAMVLSLLVLRPLLAHLLTIAHDDSEPEPQQISSEERLAIAPPKEPSVSLDRVSGQVRESTLTQLHEAAEKHPEETMQVFRAWIGEKGTKNSSATNG